MLNTFLERLGLRTADTISAPVFDGELRPNQDLDLCRLIGRELGDIDDVTIAGDGTPIVSQGNRLLAVSGHWFAPQTATLACFPGRCGAVCGLDGGGIAVAIDGRKIAIRGGPFAGMEITEAGGRPFASITAIAAAGSRLVIAEGSATNGTESWRRDLLERNASGRVVDLDLASGRSTILAKSLAWASGVAVGPDGAVVIAEAWAHCVTKFDAGGRVIARRENMPAYPGRIAIADNGGYWLSCFAARTQLVDFVLADRSFSKRMMAETPENFWIVPTLATTDHPFEPTQLGAVKQYGAKKPWAPARSYGLVIRLDADLSPLASLHSRVDGKRHGITGLVASGRQVFIVSRGHEKLMSHEEASE
jgi:hypothetical protein